MKNIQESELQCPKQLPVMYKTNVFQSDLLSYVVRRGHLSPLFEQSPFFHFPSLLNLFDFLFPISPWTVTPPIVTFLGNIIIS